MPLPVDDDLKAAISGILGCALLLLAVVWTFFPYQRWQTSRVITRLTMVGVLLIVAAVAWQDYQLPGL